MHTLNEPRERRSYNATGTTQTSIVIPGEHRMQFKLGSCELVSDYAGSALNVWEENGIESNVLATVTGTTVAVDQNGGEFTVGGLACIIPGFWCPPNSPLMDYANAGQPPPYVGVPRMGVIAAGSTAQAINFTQPMTFNQYDRILSMTELVTMRAVGAGSVSWPAPGQPKSWWTTGMGKTSLLLLNGTAACSIPYLVVEKFLDDGYWE